MVKYQAICESCKPVNAYEETWQSFVYGTKRAAIIAKSRHNRREHKFNGTTYDHAEVREIGD